MSNNPSTVPIGNVRNNWVLAPTLTPVSVANSTSAEQTFSMSAVQLGDYVYVNKPSFQAGLSIVNSRVSAKDVIAITYLNTTAATITPASETYCVHICRAENVANGYSPLVVPS